MEEAPVKKFEVIQLPQIKHRIEAIGESVKIRIEKLNIPNLIATDQTIQAIKKLRAELNNEAKNLNNEFKEVYEIVFKPLCDIKETYKQFITVTYEKAESVLKDTVTAFEFKIKKQKKDNLISFFNEFCLSEKIDFIKFDQLGIDVNLSTTEKAYKEKISAFIETVKDSLKLISTFTEIESEILTEYKASLNAAKAISTVQERKEKERIEKERIRQITIQKKITKCQSMSLYFSDFTKTYNHVRHNLFLTQEFIENSTNEEFSKKIIEIQETAKRLDDEIEKNKNINADLFVPSFIQPENVISKIIIEPKPILQAPIIEAKEETFSTMFEVTGTMKQLKQLKEFFINNKIIFKSI